MNLPFKQTQNRPLISAVIAISKVITVLENPAFYIPQVTSTDLCCIPGKWEICMFGPPTGKTALERPFVLRDASCEVEGNKGPQILQSDVI